jgi:hypothetical protein
MPHTPHAIRLYRRGKRLIGFDRTLNPGERGLSLAELESVGARDVSIHNEYYPENPADEYRILFTDDPDFEFYDEEEVPLD